MAQYFIDKYLTEPSELGPDCSVELTDEDLRCIHVAIMYFNASKISTKPAVKKTLEALDKKITLLKHYNNKSL